MIKYILILLAAFTFASCAGIERLNASHKSNSQLFLRLSQLNRELYAFRFGPTAAHDSSMLETERDAIERELLDRCESGDSSACPDRQNAMSQHQKRLAYQ